MKKFLTLLFALFAALGANLAQAFPVTYVFSGVADGSAGGVGFTGETYTFSVTADSATVQNGSPPFSNVLTRGTITITNTACEAGCSITNPSNYLVFNTASGALVHGISVVGQLDVGGQTLIEGCYASGCGGTPVNDNLVTRVPPTASGEDGALAPYMTFATGGGNVQITSLVGQITYSVKLSSAAAAVPTLSQWGLMLLSGLLALGAVIGLRRRYPG